MNRSLYAEHDYAFGQRILTLRTQMGYGNDSSKIGPFDNNWQVITPKQEVCLSSPYQVYGMSVALSSIYIISEVLI